MAEWSNVHHVVNISTSEAQPYILGCKESELNSADGHLVLLCLAYYY